MVDFQSRSTRRDDTGGKSETETAADEVSEADTAGDDDGGETPFAYAVVSVENSQSVETDGPGNAVLECIETAGGTITTRELIQPSYDGVQSSVQTLVNRDDVDAIVTVGGTGVAPTDVTVDALIPLFDKALPGFGERYRALANDTQETVIANRSTAGIIDTVPVFAVPGTVDGATTAVSQLVIPEAKELAEAARIETGDN